VRSTGLTSREFAVRLLEEEKVACVPGGAFGPGGEGHIRCCFATALEQIEEAVERMGRFVRRLRGG
jgi:aminotransferase